MEHSVHFTGHKDEVGHIMADKKEARVSSQMGEIIRTAGNEVIHTDHFVALSQ
jgi:hypothetical protein